MGTTNTGKSSTLGFVEYYNHDRIIGWAVGPDPDQPVCLKLFIDGEERKTFSPNRLRNDLRHLGNKSGVYGFDVTLPRRTIKQAFEIVSADGITLPTFPSAAGFDGWIDRCTKLGLSGWAWRVGQLENKLTIEVLYADTLIGTVKADDFRQDLLKDGIGSGAHGFHFPFPRNSVPEAGFDPTLVTARVAGTTVLLLGSHSKPLTEGSVKQSIAVGIAAAIPAAATTVSTGTPRSGLSTKLRGNLDKASGTILKGWSVNLERPDEPVILEVLCDKVVFGTTICNLYRRDLTEKSIGTGRHGFEIIAPERAVDGKPHVFTIRDSKTGVEISSGEITITRPSYYESYEGFIQHSMVSHTMQAPFDEKQKRCLAFMEFTKKWMQTSELREKPLVSIIMPAYNREDVIKAAIESVLHQTYKRWELIIVDDASTDKTAEIIRSYDSKHLRVRGIFLTENSGVSKARNAGLAAAQGSYIAYLDSDNDWDLNFLHVMLRAFEIDESAESAYCAQYMYKGHHTTPHAIRYGSFHRSLLDNRNFIDLNCFVHKRKLFDELGGFDTQLKRYVDWDLIRRYTASSAPYPVPCILSNYYLDKCDNAITTSVWDSDTVETLARKRRQAAFAIIESDSGLFRRVQPEQVELVRKTNDIVLTRVLNLAPRNLKRDINVIIPSYNATDEISVCLASLEEHLDDEHFWLTLVDNASDAETVALLRKYASHPRVRVIENAANYGFTHGVNLGISSSPPHADIVLLNNDAIATPGCFMAMQEEVLCDDAVGLVIPQQVLLPGSSTILTHVPDADVSFEVDVNISAHHKNVLNPRYNPARSTVELTFAPFFCVYIPRATLNQVGPLDAEFGRHYRSDRVYCDATRFVAGKRIIYTPSSKLYHQLQKSTEGLKLANNNAFQQLFVRNQWEEHFLKELGFKQAAWDR